MANSKKVLSPRDSGQTLQASFNEEDNSLTVGGFITVKIGHKIEKAVSTTNVANDTEEYSYFDDEILVYKVRVIYADSTRSDFISTERIE